MAPGSLDAEFRAWKRSNALVRCYTCKADPEVRAFVHALRDEGESIRAISQFLATKGIALSDGALKNHFDGGHPV